jgi:hypothetical protein
MRWMSNRRRLSPTRRMGLSVVGIAVWAGFAATGTSAFAADSPPVLVVPPSQVALHLAIRAPQGGQLKPADAWQLVAVDDPNVRIPAQIVPATAPDGSARNDSARLLASVPPREGSDQPRRFRLEPAPAAASGPDEGFQFQPLDERSLKLRDGQQPVLVYNHGVITSENVPQTDHRRSRACYVHPLWGLSGEVLTDDFPRDHYHHHGVFWTWPHVGIEGKEYDLWAGPNIKDKFVRWICRRAGTSAAVLAVENGWFVGERKVMIERVWLRAYRASGDTRSLDIEFVWIPVERPVTLRGAGGKSYGGLTVRFAVDNAKQAVITVPSGRTSADLYETPLAWVDLTCPFQGPAAPSGAAVFVHPDHPDYPPTWLTRHYGPLCVGWPGVKAKTFEPGKPIRLSYRLWIHKAAVELEQLKAAYAGYVSAANTAWE